MHNHILECHIYPQCRMCTAHHSHAVCCDVPVPHLMYCSSNSGAGPPILLMRGILTCGRQLRTSILELACNTKHWTCWQIKKVPRSYKAKALLAKMRVLVSKGPMLLPYRTPETKVAGAVRTFSKPPVMSSLMRNSSHSAGRSKRSFMAKAQVCRFAANSTRSKALLVWRARLTTGALSLLCPGIGIILNLRGPTASQMVLRHH